MISYKDFEDKLMSLRLPLPQQRLTIARTLQRAATAVGHHHFAQLTEVACGRIEAEMAPREESPRKKGSKRQREERRKVKKRSERSERPRNGGKEGAEDKEEHFALGALGPEERETHDGQGNEGFVFSPEERGGKAENAPRQLSPAEDHTLGSEPQHQPQQGGMQRRFGQPWPEGHALAPKNHPTQRKRSSRNENNHRPSHHSGRPDQEDHPHERSRRHGSKDQQQRPHRRSHTRKSSPHPPKKEKLTWKVLLRGFIKGVAAYEMNELQKKQARPQPPPQPPPPGRIKGSEQDIRPPRSPIQAASRPRIAMSSPTSSHLHTSNPSPQGRPGLRHASSSDLPPLTPDQIHWREVRAREQGQADIMRAEQEAAARQQEQSQHQTQQAGEGEPLAYREDPFAGSIPAPGPALVQRVVNAPETLAATGWSFPAHVAVSHSPSPIEDSNQTPQASPPTQTSKPMPPEWGDPIKERENRQKKRR
ncbi:hypothetical protein E2P81_ATG02639 [Venturia nashicola]|nr:hypothetical protein E2P81_ATG02639 [Venturia nashicola]